MVFSLSLSRIPDAYKILYIINVSSERIIATVFAYRLIKTAVCNKQKMYNKTICPFPISSRKTNDHVRRFKTVRPTRSRYITAHHDLRCSYRKFKDDSI
jgi:hypothetical protein